MIEQAYDVHGSPLFADGAVMPQARASMLVAHVVDPRPGDRVLDLCCAPGAKTTHLAALMGDEGEIVAVDIDATRVKAVKANCERLGVTCVDATVGGCTRAGLRHGFRQGSDRCALLRPRHASVPAGRPLAKGPCAGRGAAGGPGGDPRGGHSSSTRRRAARIRDLHDQRRRERAADRCVPCPPRGLLRNRPLGCIS